MAMDSGGIFLRWVCGANYRRVVGSGQVWGLSDRGEGVVELIKCDTFRAKISPETCRIRKEMAANPDPQHYINGASFSFMQCLDCTPEGKKRVEVEVMKVETLMKEKITEQTEPICIGCGKKASEVNKFNYKIKTCNCCYQKEYRAKKGPRQRKISKEGYMPPLQDIPCCSECGIKCTEAETFDIKVGVCGECLKVKVPLLPLLLRKAGEMIVGQGVKHDADKLRYDLVPPEALEEVVKVLTFGATKYTDRNWEKGINYGRVYGALMRHMQAFWKGEDKDIESDISHLSHAGCCLFFLLTYEGRKMREFDDRPICRKENEE